mgnify:CR=1 FL=1
MANLSFDFSNNAVFNRDKDTKTYIYRDIGTENFQLVRRPTENFSDKQTLKLYSVNTSNFDEQAVKSALNNIFKFRLGEEILEPMFGNDLYRYLYEPMNKYTAEKISKTIRQMIGAWEPRINIIDIPITRN